MINTPQKIYVKDLRKVLFVGKKGVPGATPKKEELEDLMKNLIITIKHEKSPISEELKALIVSLIPPAKKGESGHTPTREELLSLINPLIPQAKEGKMPSDEKILTLLKPLIPPPKPGQPGSTPSDYRLRNLISPLIPEPIPGSPDTGEEIVIKINHSKGAKIKRSRIEEDEPGYGGRGSVAVSTTARRLIEQALELKFGSGITATVDNFGVVHISAIGSAGSWSTPPEAVNRDGSVLVFTTTSQPNEVLADGVIYVENFGYTYAGGQITLTNGPTQYIRYR